MDSSKNEQKFNFSLTGAEFGDLILKYHHLLKWLPRSDPRRPTLLFQLVGLRTQRIRLEGEGSDLDKAITHLTELILLSSNQKTVFALFHLSVFFLKRFLCSRQPDDIKYSVKYFRFLRINFHSLDSTTFRLPHKTDAGDLSSNLFHALAYNLVLTPGDMVQDLEEMVTLVPEVITADVLTDYRKWAIEAFDEVVSSTQMFNRKDTQQVADRTIQALREATVLNSDFVISLVLARCLAARFETTLMMNDYEEAIDIADKIAATHTPRNTPTTIQGDAMILINNLLVSRWKSFAKPEYLEEAIQRLRTFIPCFTDEEHDNLTSILNSLIRQRFNYSGVTKTSGGNIFRILTEPRLQRPLPGVGQESQTTSQVREKMLQLTGAATAIMNGEITDVEAVVERSRKLLPLWQPEDQLSMASSYCFFSIFAEILMESKISYYVDEAITLCRDLRKMTASRESHFNVGLVLLSSLMARFKSWQDFQEAMQLFPKLANDHSGDLFHRVNLSCAWAVVARRKSHPSVSIAYETAMSLVQEGLVFSPTLQTQHLYLAYLFREGWRLPSDYASYQIKGRRFEQAVETLERGTALIWSEMRGLRASTDQLRAANPALADKFMNVNRRLESVTMSVAQSDGDGTQSHGSTIGDLICTQRALLDERNSLISHIQSLPGLESFLKSPSFDLLNSAASHGPVIIVNQSQNFSSHIIFLVKNSPPSIVSAPSDFQDRANRLENELLRIRKEKGLDSEDYDFTLASVLANLYELVGKSVVERLRQLGVSEKSRVWWCPTGAFCSLPLHAMGPIPSDDGNDLYFSDLYISSYTPTLSALIESRKRGPFPEVVDNPKPSILLVAQPDTLPGALGEIKVIEATKTPVKTLISAMATPETVIEGLRDHRFAHFVCHGLLETGRPFDASLELHKDNLTLLNIVRSQLPAAEFAFLSACHTAELTEDSVADEGLHLAAAMQYCGFRSVVGTMWAMADTDGADLSKHFYKAIFANMADQNGVPYHERSARALQIAVKKLRKKRGLTLERWVNFVHYGA